METQYWHYSLFKKIDKKHPHTFTMLDMKYFYPSIKETLLKNITQFAAECTDINKNDFEIMFLARKFLLFHSNQPWVKRDRDTLDVTTGTYNGAKVCGLAEIWYQY